jgi:glycosyltransferase involved in cell wall biosynthesis
MQSLTTDDADPRILEIGQVPRMHYAYPGTTEFYSTYVMDSGRSKPAGSTLVSAATLAPLASRLLDPQLDLVVVHASPHGLVEGMVRTIFRRATLSGHCPLFRGLAQQLLRRGTVAPVAVVDLEDSPFILSCNRHLLRRATLYFKRELPADRWQLLATAGKVPTRRFRASPDYQSALTRIRSLSLGLPDHILSAGSFEPAGEQKNIDVFFAGKLHGSSTVRERGIQELMPLRDAGYRIEIREGGLSPADYLELCSRAWLVWAPQGYGWDCFRSYEAAFAGSVPLISRQTIERHQPLNDGEHAVYYDLEPGALARAVRRTLENRERLLAMAQAARQHVLHYHTPTALARYVVRSTLAAGGRSLSAESA